MSFKLNGVEIEDTFAEGFSMWGSRLIITAVNEKWSNIATPFNLKLINHDLR